MVAFSHPVHPHTGRFMILPSELLPDIRWISGGSCGGKTVISRNISEKTGLKLYCADDYRQNHFERADPVLHPALSRKIDWADFFSSSEEEIYSFWEALCFERMEMILDDLSRYGVNESVIAEGVYPLPEIIKAVTPESPAVFLFAEENFMRNCYYGRESTLWMESLFAMCRDPGESRKAWIDKWLYIDGEHEKRAAVSGYPVFYTGYETDWKSYEDIVARSLGLKAGFGQ